MNVSTPSYNEPDIMKQISNTTICTWFYIMFILNVIFAFMALMYIAYRSASLNIPVGYKLLFLTVYTLFLAFPVVNATFFYIMCERALPSSRRYL